jgi:hypothetical protein
MQYDQRHPVSRKTDQSFNISKEYKIYIILRAKNIKTMCCPLNIISLSSFSLSLSLSVFLGLPYLNQRKGNTNTFGTKQAVVSAGSAEHCSFCSPVGDSLLNHLPTNAKDLVCPAIMIS